MEAEQAGLWSRECGGIQQQALCAADGQCTGCATAVAVGIWPLGTLSGPLRFSLEVFSSLLWGFLSFPPPNGSVESDTLWRSLDWCQWSGHTGTFLLVVVAPPLASDLHSRENSEGSWG